MRSISFCRSAAAATSILALLAIAPAASADAAAATATITASPTTPDKPPASNDHAAEGRSNGVLIGAKVGGILPFSKLGPNVSGGVEVGYAFGNFAVAIDADYTAPQASGTESDPRVTGSTYTWHLTEQELNVMPVFLYRMPLGKLTPFVGIGPRIYFLKSTVRSNTGTPSFSETTEQSMKYGFGIPFGLEIKAGPGGFLAEVLLQYGGLDHTATGSSNTGSASLSLGYRIIL
jgi:opacity protein-like surface antigen